jgi:hypothetical protein
MGKTKIGTKLTAGEDNGTKRKEFTDGHKFFTPMQSLFMSQTHVQERRRLENFERDKMILTRDPNPIQGEVTRAPAFFTEFYEPKIVQPEVITANSAILPVNPLRRGDKSVEHVNCLQNLQDNISGELNYMKQKIREEEAKLKAVSSKSIRF